MDYRIAGFSIVLAAEHKIYTLTHVKPFQLSHRRPKGHSITGQSYLSYGHPERDLNAIN